MGYYLLINSVVVSITTTYTENNITWTRQDKNLLVLISSSMWSKCNVPILAYCLGHTLLNLAHCYSRLGLFVWFPLLLEQILCEATGDFPASIFLFSSQEGSSPGSCIGVHVTKKGIVFNKLSVFKCHYKT